MPGLQELLSAEHLHISVQVLIVHQMHVACTRCATRYGFHYDKCATSFIERFTRQHNLASLQGHAHIEAHLCLPHK